ncbi:MAG: hypothetical protein SF162_06265 [bacterium]|nr:hypothetical protein [bacterium]
MTNPPVPSLPFSSSPRPDFPGRTTMETLYPFLHDVHTLLSRVGLFGGLIMFGVGFYIAIVRHGDVTKWFLAVVYLAVILMGIAGLTGLAMYAAGGRPYDPVHIIYGVGVVLALPFFIYVERTATKRPAMGSYLWGFGLLAAIILRSIVTGAG